MKLIRWGDPRQERTGVIIGDVRYDTSEFGEDYNEQFFGGDGLIRLNSFLQKNEGRLRVIPETERMAAPFARPSKILCIGLNYAKHAAESNMAIPAEPIIFMKATSSLTGPGDDIIIPRNSVKTDWEVELAFVIGKRASYVPESRAMDHVAGYCLHNDVSEREFQLERGGTWDKGKGCDTFAPMGPFLATPDEIEDPHKLRLWLKLNGRLVQDGNTDDLIFNVPFLVSYLSNFMTLLPGDVISTGTPAGVGLGFKPPIFLKPGDCVELWIEGLGESRQMVRGWMPQGSNW